MNFLKDLVATIGPGASFMFAAWIFLSFLQQRYTSSYDRYRSLLQAYREHPTHDQRQRSLREQIVLYKGRCEKMRLATNLGIVSAMSLLAAMIFGAVYFAYPALTALQWVSAVGIVLGLLLVVVASAVVLVENLQLQEAIDSEMSDVPELLEEVRRTHRTRTVPAEQHS
jgi:hypothetical protein